MYLKVPKSRSICNVVVCDETTIRGYVRVWSAHWTIRFSRFFFFGQAIALVLEKKLNGEKVSNTQFDTLDIHSIAQIWTFQTILINLLISVTVCPTRKFLRMMRIQRSNWCRSWFIILNKTLQTKVFTTIQNDNCGNLILIYSKNNLRVLPNVSAQLEAHE